MSSLLVEDQTLWLSQALIARLFQKVVRTINKHLQNIYAENEFEVERTIRSFRIVRREGKRDVARLIQHYSLDAILAADCRAQEATVSEMEIVQTEGNRRISRESHLDMQRPLLAVRIVRLR